MGLGDFHQFASSADVDMLIEQFKELQSRDAELRQQMASRNADKVQSLEEQFTLLSTTLFPAKKATYASGDGKRVDGDR
jgi:hypothetical protein